MPLVKAADVLPQEGVTIHVYDATNQRLEFGRYVGGRWYVEDGAGGRLREIVGVTHWGPVLDSEVDDQSDDD